MAKKAAEGEGILERGDIYFLYRQKVQEEHPRKQSDVERAFLYGTEPGRQKNLSGINHRTERAAESSERKTELGLVKTVVRDAKELEKKFGEVEYSTKSSTSP